MNYNKILNKVLAEIKPTHKEVEEQQKVADEVIRKIKAMKGKPVDVIMVGSAARGSDLKGDKDLDIFILFPLTCDEKDLEKEGLKIGKEIAKGHKFERKFASHPYVKTEINGFDIDIVPAFKIKNIKDFKSAVDRSPLHQEFIKNNRKPGEGNQVRLLKKFCKSLDIYGAEMGTWGFPGYLCELLVMQYGSFIDTLKMAENWEYNQVIDIKKHYKSKSEILKKFNTPLIVIDPTDKNRNVGAAVSDNVFAKFIHYSRQFLEKPSEEFFKEKIIKEKKPNEIEKRLKQRRAKILVITTGFPKVPEDIAVSQLEKTMMKMKKMLEDEDFKTHRVAMWTNRKNHSAFLFEFEVWELPPVKVRHGPPLTIIKDQKKFLEKHKSGNVWIEGDRWATETVRKETDAIDYLKRMVKEMKSGKTRIPSHIEEVFNKKVNILDAKGIMKEYEKNEYFAKELTEYLYKRERFLEV
ncbi:MAG: CCA tRNA nucleotidyltransferase [Candidatus Diapherotrites archaeon]|nr:CCA tRNA nucleotidyltransferase [Candidatus Diapherotrites archaeon]